MGLPRQYRQKALSLTRLQSYLRANALPQHESVAVPPFTLFFHPTDRSTEANYAIPDELREGNLAEPVSDVKRVFVERHRTPCVRYIHEFAPSLAETLEGEGLSASWRSPLMICTPETYRRPAEIPGLTMVITSSDSPLEEVGEGWNVNARGFDPAAQPGTDAEIEEFRKSLVTSRGFTARLDGQAVSAGMFTEIRDGITELVGITTLEPFRRRGLASALTACMAYVVFEHGVEAAFLVAANEHAGRVYERVGFQRYATLVEYAHRPSL